MISVELEEKQEGTFLKLPDIPDISLPPVTLVTPTYNRFEQFDIAIRNYKNFNYPRNKLFWIILDDSPIENLINPLNNFNKMEQLLRHELPNEYGNRVIYHHHKIDKPKKLKIGQKRNMLADMCKTDIICHMDDDDYYYPDSIKIRVTSLYFHKKPVCGCIEYNCYNLIDDTQFIARGTEELMNVGEASLCYLKSYWDDNKYDDTVTHEESIEFLKNNADKFVNLPCLWILLSITHGKNTSARRSINLVLNFSFLDLLPVSDLEFLKQQKLKLMLNDQFNQNCMKLAKDINASNQKEKLIDKLTIKQRKNIIIRELLNTIPSKTQCINIDFLIICFPAQYIRKIDFEKENELIELIKKNKNNYRFTIYTECDKGYSFDGITVSPYWKWRSCNKYHKVLVMYDPSHLKLNINAEHKYFYNKYEFDIPEVNLANSIEKLSDAF